MQKKIFSLDEHQIFLQGPVVVFKWKNVKDWPVEYVSSNVEENLGYKKEDFLLNRIKYGDIIFEDDLIQVSNEVSNYSLSERNMFEQEYRIVKSNGEIVWIYDYTTIVRDENRAITHFYGYILDITKHKRNEEALRRTEKLNTIGEFAAGIAHEIRNPLTSLRGFLQLIKNGQIKEEYKDIMESELDRIESILNEFLILSKPHLTQYNKKDVHVLFKQILPLFETQATYNNIQLVTEFDLDELMINCNENQLKQVFVNFIKNAIEATSNGGVIKIECKKEQNELCIRFIDEGSGISEENIKRLGEPFFTTKENGTGLGLMISFKIIEEHGGTIQVESQLGIGSIFKIKLPFC
ncbi:PAS domain-containing sensor histidine kinase [Alteribacillus bidgolensis]|uniref:histidine kinase n=1 Tax=Alteribacillus bidgolensis TaxID=930129 RepID=A0A1G8RKN2_9BACI|nr:PAS domain-containing sensor histidine kinase [Alteribacillus bidgolensis]SDJ17548.1 two-component system, chemotaxis family, CheB/CheR fusion protein [Alteribacillus bidgolensis]